MDAFRFCNTCVERHNEIRADWEHIYVKHSYRTGVDDVSLFRSDISLLVYYNTFIAELREGNLRGELDLDHGSERLVYYCPFDFVVGTFPDRNRCRRGGRIIQYETYFVKVVCATSRCPNQLCCRLFPTFVITMYPHIGHNSRHLIEKEAYGIYIQSSDKIRSRAFCYNHKVEKSVKMMWLSQCKCARY